MKKQLGLLLATTMLVAGCSSAKTTTTASMNPPSTTSMDQPSVPGSAKTPEAPSKETEMTKTYQGVFNNVNIKNVYKIKDDMVIQQDSTNEFEYAKLNLVTDAQKQEFLNKIKTASQSMQGVKGVTESLKQTENGVVEMLQIDYTKADLKELADKKIISIPNYNGEKFISWKSTKSLIESEGFKEIAN